MLSTKKVNYEPIKFSSYIENKTLNQLKVIQETLIKDKKDNSDIKNSNLIKKYIYCQKEDKNYINNSLYNTTIISSIPIIYYTLKNSFLNFINNKYIKINETATNGMEEIGNVCTNMLKYTPIILLISMGYNSLNNIVFSRKLIEKYNQNLDYCEKLLNDKIDEIEKKMESDNINYTNIY